MTLRMRLTLDCRDGVHAACGACDCTCHQNDEALIMCGTEWHDAAQAPDDNHHCTRTHGHTGPHVCGWCQDLGRQ